MKRERKEQQSVKHIEKERCEDRRLAMKEEQKRKDGVEGFGKGRKEGNEERGAERNDRR